MMYNMSLSIQVQPISTIPIWGANQASQLNSWDSILSQSKYKTEYKTQL